MALKALISCLIEMLVLGFIVWVIYKFFTGILDSFNRYIFKVYNMDRKDGKNKTAFFWLDLFNQVLSYILFLFVLFLFPIILVLVINFFNEVIHGGGSPGLFLAHINQKASLVTNFYLAVWHWGRSIFHHLTS